MGRNRSGPHQRMAKPNLHVLWHRLDKALNQLAGPTPTAVSESTMNMALTLHDTLLAFGGVAEAVSVHFLFVM